MATATSIAAAEAELNELIRTGKALDGFDRFYADDVEMQENTDTPVKGKPANRKREEEFFASVESVNSIAVHASATEGDVSFSEWTFDVNFKGGQRVALQQVAVRRWKDGQIVHERFYYNKA